MTDEIDTSFPERIWAWADENDDKGWSLVPITGTMEGKPDPEYVRADLYDAERQRAEKAEAERDRLRQAAHFVHGLPPGEWETWDSCSFRRISSRGSCRDGDVLHGIVHRSDGHPDLSWDDKTCWALCHLVNGLRAALRQDEGDDE